MDLPISLKIENAKGKLLSALNDTSIEYKITGIHFGGRDL